MLGNGYGQASVGTIPMGNLFGCWVKEVVFNDYFFHHALREQKGRNTTEITQMWIAGNSQFITDK